ncbi:MAG TPA: hypothetical protein VF306_23030 [Pirellulales bacterium]
MSRLNRATCGVANGADTSLPAAPAPRTVEPPNARVIVIGVLTAAAIAGLIAYFAFVLAPP